MASLVARAGPVVALSTLLALAMGLSLGLGACQPDEPTRYLERRVGGPTPGVPAKGESSQKLCQLTLEGTALLRALIWPEGGEPIDATIRAEGTLLEYLCPADTKADTEALGRLIGLRETGAGGTELVQARVRMAPPVEDVRVRAEDFELGTPGLTSAERIVLRERWADIDLSPYDQASAPDPERPSKPGKPKAPPGLPAKVPVHFKAAALNYARLRVTGPGGQPTLQMTLDPNALRELTPGRYALAVMRGNDEQWRPAGSLEVVAGKQEYVVQFQRTEPITAEVRSQ
ncbi:hypothetical protein [Plesiocystis pacifica]|uniref:hypothetical protein n=1 Tax=Plesiocystis pacifica TaxID=191768 RepID=UPI0012FABDF2|nr:hypothetical protein [Plesiocystis pacifica]